MANLYRLARLAAGYSAALIGSKLLVLALNLTLAYNISDIDFGFISISQAYFMAAICVFGLNLQSAFTRYTYEFGAGAVLSAVAHLYVGMLVFALLAGVVIFLILGPDSPFAWFALLPLSGLAASHLASGSAVARVTNNLKAYAAGELLRPGCIFLGMLCFLMAPPILPIGPFFIVALLVSSLLAALVSWKLQENDIATKKKILSYSKVISYVSPLFLMQIVALANGISDKFFLSAWFPLEDVGSYSKSYIVGSSIGMLFDSFSLLWSPYVVANKERYSNLFHSWVRFIYILSWCTAVVLILIAYVFIYFLEIYIGFGKRDLIFLSLLISAAFVVRTGYQVCVPVLSAFDMTPLVAKLAIKSAIVGLIANICLIYLFGAIGAAFATLAAFAVFSIGAYNSVVRIVAIQTGVGTDDRCQ